MDVELRHPVVGEVLARVAVVALAVLKVVVGHRRAMEWRSFSVHFDVIKVFCVKITFISFKVIQSNP